MERKKIRFSTFDNCQPAVQECEQILPFFAFHSVSFEQMKKACLHQKMWKVWTQNRVLYLAVEINEKNLRITNILTKNKDLGLAEMVELLDAFGRSLFMSTYQIRLATRNETYYETRLLQLGFTKTDILTKKITYHTALVLGGGGAHGAYQIGVWQALSEQGIEIQLVVGTSVGALNGALFIQGDLEAAKSLWNSLSTNQVLALPPESATNDLKKKFSNETRQLLLSAMLEKGVSTAPLRSILTTKIETKKIKDSAIKLITVATAVPSFEEVITVYSDTAETDFVDYLLASASFYPAMAYLELHGQKYIDGGYKNNVPIDIAVEYGATEAIIVDVQGPGMTKKYRPAAHFFQWVCKSPWSLGSFLLFDAKRNQINHTLGYLETKKMFGDYSGYWYTFSKENMAKLWHSFLEMLAMREIKLDKLLDQERFLLSLRSLYKESVIQETCGLAIVEILAKIMHVAPYKVYTEEIIKQEIYLQATQKHPSVPSAQLGADEWFTYTKETNPYLSQKNKLLKYANNLKKAETTWIVTEIKRRPVQTVLALFYLYIEEELQ